MTEDIGGIALFPGVDRLLRELAGRGIRLAVVTSNSIGNVRQVLGSGQRGTDPALRVRRLDLRQAAEARGPAAASGVPAAEAICIGDEIRDLEAARAEGIPFGAVTWGYTNPEALRAPQPEEVFPARRRSFRGWGKALGLVRITAPILRELSP